jgi:hypothetical protein
VRYGAPYEVPDGVASRQHAADVVERVLHELTHAA